ncbi:hypothetical protein HFO56_00895 [Rhizobium laguerreae]|uniref:hypothetical protein n=1 Tax=Rhizobium laguerreae TaxID=1076926 RepID=UPI001C90A424|nr:hypothetical protein [Rhizobium laguerreae]MBY3150987.1 hypothetical protein [Rhizobium laguerreae]
MTGTGFDFSAMEGMSRSTSASTPNSAPEVNERDETFRVKVSMQQFMNHNGPIFKAFAYKGIEVREVADGNALIAPTEAAANLTQLVTKAILDKRQSDLTAKDLSFFRTEAANWVSERWIRDEDYDIEKAAASIATAVLQAGKDWDHDPYKDDRISNDASLMMSAAGVTAKLMKQVEVYDFRLGRNEVLKTLLDAVIGTAVQVSSDMLPRAASKYDTANLIQTVSRNFASIMEAIYERKARDVVGLLQGRKTEQRTAWLDANRPLDTIVAEFHEWALCFVGFAVATSARIAAPAPVAETPSRTVSR